jgi:DNA polymerase delta subunit 2
MIPSFAKTGQVALVCLETLECKMVGFEVPGWIGDSREEGEEEDVKME